MKNDSVYDDTFALAPSPYTKAMEETCTRHVYSKVLPERWV